MRKFERVFEHEIMRFVILLSVFLFFVYGKIDAQIINFSKAKQETLDNGLTVLAVTDSSFSGLVVGYYCEYPVIRNKTEIGSDLLFAALTGGQVIGRSIYKYAVVSPGGRVDSILSGIRSVVFDSAYDAARILQARQQLREKDFFVKTAYYTVLGRRHYMSLDLSMYLGLDTVLKFRRRLNPDHSLIVVYGAVPTDSVFKSVRRYFSGLVNVPYDYTRRKLPPKRFSVNYVEKDTQTVGFAFPLKYNFKQNFLNVAVLEAFLDMNYPDINQSAQISDDVSVFYAFMPAGTLSKSFYRLRDLLRRFSAGDFTRAEFAYIKQALLDRTLVMFKNPVFIADMMFYYWHYSLSPDFLAKYYNTVRNLSYASLKKYVIRGLADSSAFILMGEKQRNWCDVMTLADSFRINLYDAQLYKYNVITHGFDANVIIRRYLDFVLPAKPLKNLEYDFKGYFFADSEFVDISGKVYRKKPDYYKFFTFVPLSNDTLLHYLSIYDGQQWYDSTGAGRIQSDTLSYARNYLFSELFYKDLSYTPQVICDPVLSDLDIYKIRVSTPDGYFYYDYYDNAQKIKLYTEFYSQADSQWLMTVFYDDYRRIKLKGVDFKIPFTIKEQTPDYTMLMNLTDISAGRIPAKVFSPSYPLWQVPEPGKKKHYKRQDPDKYTLKKRRRWNGSPKKCYKERY